MKDIVITLIFGTIMTLNFVDVLTDIELGVPTWHIIEESIIVLISGLCVIYLLWDMRLRNQRLRHLTRTLSGTDQELRNLTAEMKRARHQFSEIIRAQFQDWQLTDSEQEVAMLLLKGLSFKEIASVRNTKEKTVRQQASTIYAKSGLDGRHSFSAWFLEDFLTEKYQQEEDARAA